MSESKVADVEFVLYGSIVEIKLPMTELVLRFPFREGVSPQDLADARNLFARRCELHSTLSEGLDSIRAGRAGLDAYDRADCYLRQVEASNRAIWDAAQLALGLTLDLSTGDLSTALPRATDGMVRLVSALYSRIGLSAPERENLVAGALEDLGLPQPDKDGNFRRCDCADVHGRGRCPNWPPFAWLPRARRVYNDWRSARAGGKIDVTLAYLDGSAILGEIAGEIEAERIRRMTASQAAPAVNSNGPVEAIV